MTIASTHALASLRRMGKRVVTTEDVALCLGQERSAASRTLGRLSAAGLIAKLRHGLWSLEPHIDPLLLPEHLTAPFPSYVSLMSALYLHGMISQVPHTIYVVSLAPTRRIRTRIADFSVHRLAPSFFGGFDTVGEGVRLARPEKALLDLLYLTPARSRLFAALPEVEIPRGFDLREARRWITKIRPGARRLAVERRLAALLPGGQDRRVRAAKTRPK